MTKTDPMATLVAEILAGRHDGALVGVAKQVSEAIAERQRGTGGKFLWRLTLDGDTWDAETVTIGELSTAEAMTGKHYLDISPSNSMRDFSALVVAHYIAGGESREGAFKRAESITQTQAMGALELYEGTLGKGSGAPPSS